MKTVLSFVRRRLLLLLLLASVVLALCMVDFGPLQGNKVLEAELKFEKRKAELERKAHDAELKRSR